MANDCHWAGPLGVEDVLLGFMQEWTEAWNQLVVTLSRIPAPNLRRHTQGVPVFPSQTFPLKRKRSQRGNDWVADGVSPHLFGLRATSGAWRKVWPSHEPKLNTPGLVRFTCVHLDSVH